MDNEIIQIKDELRLISKKMSLITNQTILLHQRLDALLLDCSTDSCDEIAKIEVRLLDGRNFMINLDMNSYEELNKKVKEIIINNFEIYDDFVLVSEGVRLQNSGIIEKNIKKLHVIFSL